MEGKRFWMFKVYSKAQGTEEHYPRLLVARIVEVPNGDLDNVKAAEIGLALAEVVRGHRHDSIEIEVLE